MIKLRDILQEFDYGKLLFADPKSYGNTSNDDLALVDLGYSDPERDTKDEVMAMRYLASFFSDGDSVHRGELEDIFDTLLGLKTRFPKVLDPSTSPNYGLAFRGATISFDALKDLPWKVVPAVTPKGRVSAKYDIQLTVTDNLVVHPRSDRGFHSFSTMKRVAYNFAAIKSIHFSTTSNIRVPIVLGVDINDPNLLFSTKFTQLHSEYGDTEYEILHIGNDINVSYLLIPGYSITETSKYINAQIDQYPEFFASKYSDFYPIYQQWYDALTK